MCTLARQTILRSIWRSATFQFSTIGEFPGSPQSYSTRARIPIGATSADHTRPAGPKSKRYRGRQFLWNVRNIRPLFIQAISIFRSLLNIHEPETRELFRMFIVNREAYRELLYGSYEHRHFALKGENGISGRACDLSNTARSKNSRYPARCLSGS